MHVLFRRRCWIAPLLALIIGLAWVSAPVARSQGTPVPAAQFQFTPLLPSVLSPPRWFHGADEQIHLVYELLLTNAFPVPVEVTTVEVLDAGTGRSLATLTGETLATAMSLLPAPSTAATSLPPGTVGVVWFDLILADAEHIPPTIEHRLTVAVPPGLPVPPSITMTAGMATVDLRPPVVLGPPLAGTRWVVVGGCCDSQHRRGFQPIDGELHLSQRFAIDFNRLDADNRTNAGDPTLNTSSPSYGEPVLAVADATVVTAIDQYPDQIPNAPTGVALEMPEGNHIILDLGDGRYALYAHLKPGSVGVQTGERVQRGQVIGELGNSGNSMGPHLHFHVMDSPSGLVADGVPYGFDQFELTGQTPPVAELLILDENQEPVPINTQGAGPRHDALPLGRDVVTFPDVGASG
jgi:hypothetical protein